MAYAVLADPSVLISSSYQDTDTTNQFRQRAILSSLGTMFPTDGNDFVLLSTGIAGAQPVTTNGDDPGSERGTWFGPKNPGWSGPYDEATFTIQLKVPPFMHNLSYDLQFFSMEYPDYVGSQYNDKVTVTVDSPSKGVSTYIFDVNSGDFVFESSDIPGTGFDLFAVRWSWWQQRWVPTSPSNPDTVTTTPYWSDDAGASALITRQHAVGPNETITITFDIRDVGDNQFDSAVFIDNVHFTGYGFTSIRALKTWQDVNGGTLEPGDRIHYMVTISNSGTVDQPDNPGNEFEDVIPDNTTYVPNSVSSTSGSATYDAGGNKIVWNGAIPGESSVLVSFDVLVDSNLEQTTVISNQGTVFWDENEDGVNEAQELTDDPATDDGVDQDGDGETGDDDPTLAVVLLYNISEMTEDFSDDTPGESAHQDYYGFDWFSTSHGSAESIFEVAGGYHYSTPNSFKTQLRSTCVPQYWNYSLSWMSGLTPTWWQVNFTCGNNSEPFNLILSFKNQSGAEITRLKFEYISTDADPPNNYAPVLYYLTSNDVWVQLSSDYENGFLFNGWYTLKLQQNGTSGIDYLLYHVGGGLTDKETGVNLETSFSQLSRIEWSTTCNPVVAPMFFWDEHKLGFT
ncbi:MAG: DUF11 domain-containing protein [Thermoplasmata archaeon]|nr:MAG: DUF11 domain-containing protein [Thermoplasmata archaeon]